MLINFIPGFTSVDREGRSTSHFHLWQTWRFQFHITNVPFLSSNIPTSPAYGVFISQLIRYARACSSYGCFILRATWLSNKLLEQEYIKESLKSSLRKFYVRYGLSWNVKWHSVTWPYTMTTPYWSAFVPNSTFYRILSGFHRTFATGVACRQGTLTPPDTWSCPRWDLQLFFCWDHWHAIIHDTSLWYLSLTWLFTDFDAITEYRFP